MQRRTGSAKPVPKANPDLTFFFFGQPLLVKGPKGDHYRVLQPSDKKCGDLVARHL